MDRVIGLNGKSASPKEPNEPNKLTAANNPEANPERHFQLSHFKSRLERRPVHPLNKMDEIAFKADRADSDARIDRACKSKPRRRVHGHSPPAGSWSFRLA
jgi:hypothetical protein